MCVFLRWMQATRQRMLEQDRREQENKSDWFDRFLKLAEALYELDENNSGTACIITYI